MRGTYEYIYFIYIKYRKNIIPNDKKLYLTLKEVWYNNPSTKKLIQIILHHPATGEEVVDEDVVKGHIIHIVWKMKLVFTMLLGIIDLHLL